MQDFHIHHMEDKLKLIHSAKDEVQQMNSQQACVISELQTKNNSLSMTVDNLKRQIESLQQVTVLVLNVINSPELLFPYLYFYSAVISLNPLVFSWILN